MGMKLSGAKIAGGEDSYNHWPFKAIEFGFALINLVFDFCPSNFA